MDWIGSADNSEYPYNDHTCHYCGLPLPRSGSYCSRCRDGQGEEEPNVPRAAWSHQAGWFGCGWKLDPAVRIKLFDKGYRAYTVGPFGTAAEAQEALRDEGIGAWEEFPPRVFYVAPR